MELTGMITDLVELDRIARGYGAALLAAERYADEAWRSYRAVVPTDAMLDRPGVLDAIEASWPALAEDGD